MQLRLPASLHYPITVTELLKRPNDSIDRFAPLFSYFYKTTVIEGDDLGNEYQVEKTFPTRFESSVEGTLSQWRIQKGAVIFQAKYVRISTVCTGSTNLVCLASSLPRLMNHASTPFNLVECAPTAART